MIEGFSPPCTVFQMRVRDDSIEGPNPYRWHQTNSDELLKGKRVVIFSLPGAFTPTCSTYQLPAAMSSSNTGHQRNKTQVVKKNIVAQTGKMLAQGGNINS